VKNKKTKNLENGMSPIYICITIEERKSLKRWKLFKQKHRVSKITEIGKPKEVKTKLDAFFIFP